MRIPSISTIVSAVAAAAVALLAGPALLAQDMTPCVAFKPCSDPTEPGVVATFDGESIRLTDLDPDTRKSVAQLDSELKKARLAVVDAEVADTLFHLEAKRRNLRFKDFLYGELAAPVAPPDESAVKAEMAARPERYKRGGEEDFDRARARVWDAAFAQRRKQVRESLEKRYPVKLLYEGGSLPKGAVAVVGKKRISAESVAKRIAAAEAEVRISIEDEKQEAVDRLIDEHLLQQEARRRGVTTDELIRIEVTDKVIDPTESEVRGEWEKERRYYRAEYAAARAQVEEDLREERVETARETFREMLRGKRTPQLSLGRSAPLPVPIGSSPGLRVGSRSPRVTVVEWGDFQCPPCGRMAPVVEEAIKSYGENVAYVFRNSPLTFHRFAWKAAEAALAANAQGKGEPYMKTLFSNQGSLDGPALHAYAEQIGLDMRQFDRDLTTGRFAADVFLDKYEGARAGVQGTPTFFVNGVRLGYNAYSVEGIKAAIGRELRAARR